MGSKTFRLRQILFDLFHRVFAGLVTKLTCEEHFGDVGAGHVSLSRIEYSEVDAPVLRTLVRRSFYHHLRQGCLTRLEDLLSPALLFTPRFSKVEDQHGKFRTLYLRNLVRDCGFLPLGLIRNGREETFSLYRVRLPRKAGYEARGVVAGRISDGSIYPPGEAQVPPQTNV